MDSLLFNGRIYTTVIFSVGILIHIFFSTTQTPIFMNFTGNSYNRAIFHCYIYFKLISELKLW